MKTTWTPAQILALAPDSASAKSGQELTNPRKWVTLGWTTDAAWGECQGSGKTPYQTQIALAEPAFKCSCPSRKFPCKHGLGLLLLLEKQPEAFTQAEEPEWVTSWLAGRSQKAEQKAEKAEKTEAADADPAAQAKRAAQREGKVAAGLADLDRWLRDLVRHGLADAGGKPYQFWDGPAARLVDTQVPGAARLVRLLAGAGGTERLLERLGRLHLLVEGYKHLDSLPAETQADVRAALGFTLKEEEVLAGPSVRDRWIVVGQSVEEENRLRVQRTWLHGSESRRAALTLQFVHATQALETSLVPGSCLDAELAFYPGAYPLRALVKTRHDAPCPLAALPGHDTIMQATGSYAAALACQPWLERFPMALQNVVPGRAGTGWLIRDSDQIVLPLAPRADDGWTLIALSGGHPVTLFGTWDGDILTPLSLFAEGQFHAL